MPRPVVSRMQDSTKGSTSNDAPEYYAGSSATSYYDEKASIASGSNNSKAANDGFTENRDDDGRFNNAAVKVQNNQVYNGQEKKSDSSQDNAGNINSMDNKNAGTKNNETTDQKNGDCRLSAAAIQQQIMNAQHSKPTQQQPIQDMNAYQQIYHPAVAAAVAASAFFQKSSNQGSLPNQPSHFPPTASFHPSSVGGVPVEYSAQSAHSNAPSGAPGTNNHQIQNPNVSFQSHATMHHKPSPFHMMYPKQFQVTHQSNPIFSSHPTANPGYILPQAQHAANFTTTPMLNAYNAQQQAENAQNQKSPAFSAPSQSQSQQRPPNTSKSEQLGQMLQKAHSESSTPSHLSGTNHQTQHVGPPGTAKMFPGYPQYPSPTRKDALPPGTNTNLYNSPLMALNPQGQTPPTPLNEMTSPTTPQLHGVNYSLPNPQSTYLHTSMNFHPSTFRGIQQHNPQDTKNTESSPKIKSDDEDDEDDDKKETKKSKRKNSTDEVYTDEDLKKQKAREKNRIHSRNSRLRKKDSILRMKEDNNFLQMFKVITEAMADMVSVHDLSDEARLVYANPSFVAKYVVPDTMQFPGLQLFHRQPNVRVPSSFLQLVHEEDAKTLIECLCLVRYDTTQAPILSVRMLASSAPPSQDGSRLYANFQARIQASPSVGTLIIVTRPLGSDNDCYRYIPKNLYTATEVTIAPTGFVV